MPLLLQVWKIHNSCGGFDNEQDNKYIFNAFKFAQLIFFGRKWPVTVKNRAVKNTILLAEISDGAYSTINGWICVSFYIWVGKIYIQLNADQKQLQAC